MSEKLASSPVTTTTAPISTAAKQEQHQNDNQDQFHRISPVKAMALMRQGSQAQRSLPGIVPLRER
jgi:hypothetical protein